MIPVISIVLSIALPAFALWKSRGQKPLRRPWLFCVGSFVACASGIIAQIFTIKRRLFAGDTGGIEDTIDAVLLLCIVLLVITAVLNLLLLRHTYKHR